MRNAIETGRRVARLEAEALEALAECIGDSFSDAVDLILQCRGRVITSGMGKSGHIARKIAATLASTGTPAYFVHPAEASHGDLGMITAGDVLLVLSNSGETTELRDVLAWSDRLAIPVIGMSSKPESMLMRASRVAINLPNLPEACAIGMAPTTSSIIMMCMGDALAVAIMEARGVDAQKFSEFHPAGSLGQRLKEFQNAP